MEYKYHYDYEPEPEHDYDYELNMDINMIEHSLTNTPQQTKRPGKGNPPNRASYKTAKTRLIRELSR